MKIESVRKEYVIVAVVVIICISIIFSYKNIQRAFYEANADPRCVEDKSKQFSPNTLRGQLTVVFKEAVKEQEARRLIDSYGLIMGSFGKRSRVYVSEGYEHIWMCILESSDIVEATYLIYRTQPR